MPSAPPRPASSHHSGGGFLAPLGGIELMSTGRVAEWTGISPRNSVFVLEDCPIDCPRKLNFDPVHTELRKHAGSIVFPFLKTLGFPLGCEQTLAFEISDSWIRSPNRRHNRGVYRSTSQASGVFPGGVVFSYERGAPVQGVRQWQRRCPRAPRSRPSFSPTIRRED